VDPRLQHRDPERRAQEEVGRLRRHSHAVEYEKPGEEEKREEERPHRELRSVEHRDDEDRGEVVDHRDRGEENLQRQRDAAAQQGEDAQGESDVGGRGDGPAAQRRRIVPVDERVDRGRHGDAPDGADERQRHLPAVAEFAGHDLAFQLESDEEEKDRHEAVVDPEEERLGDREAPQADLRLEGQELLVGRGESRVRDDQGEAHRSHEEEAGQRLFRKDAGKRGRHGDPEE